MAAQSFVKMVIRSRIPGRWCMKELFCEFSVAQSRVTIDKAAGIASWPEIATTRPMNAWLY